MAIHRRWRSIGLEKSTALSAKGNSETFSSCHLFGLGRCMQLSSILSHNKQTKALVVNH
jgi:hypothetical protein